MKINKTEDYHEDNGPAMFFSFSRDKEGNLLGEPPEVCFSFGYLEVGFDEEKWTHWIDGRWFNFVFTSLDPVSFPDLGLKMPVENE